jgi:hypothetical protein
MTRKKRDQEKENPKREPLHVIRRRPQPPAPPLPPRMVSPEKLKESLEKDLREMKRVAEVMTYLLRSCPEIKEIEVPLGFSNEGRFMGIGTGAPITLRIHVKL